MPYSRFVTAAAIVVAFLAAAIVVRFLQAVVHRAIDALEIVSSENRAGLSEGPRSERSWEQPAQQAFVDGLA